MLFRYVILRTNYKARFVYTVAIVAWLMAFLAYGTFAAGAKNGQYRLVALGDSLTAGYGLASADSFPVQLQNALQKKGYNVSVINAGVSGDTVAGGLARLDWSVDETADGVIIELGANDGLRGIPPDSTRRSLDEILARLTKRKIDLLLTGMVAPPNMGPDYGDTFNAIFPDLASKYNLVFYPFFLEGVAAIRALNQPDGLHPTAQGVKVIVTNILPKVEELLKNSTHHR